MELVTHGRGKLVYAIAIVMMIGAVMMVCYYRQHTKRILKQMDAMLEQAISGEFQEQLFDESMQSAIEAKLSDYLSSSLVSTRNLQEEKEHIKTWISDISHQTKTPIANILLYTQLLKEQQLSKESMSYVETLETQTEKLQRLIDGLVKTSRLENGILCMHPVKQNVYPMLEDVRKQYQQKAQEKNIVLQLEETEAEAVFDAKWTNEAVCNLIDNAIKYTAEGGQVSVRVKLYELFCRIDVCDTGVGIAEQEQAKIFARFYRGSGQYEQEGVGIGLYLVRQIAAGQGGYVKVSSKVGEGSTFSLFLPQNNM